MDVAIGPTEFAALAVLLLGSVLFGLCLGLFLPFRLNRSSGKREAEAMPHWIAINPTLQQHLLQGPTSAPVVASAQHHDSLSASEPRQPHPGCDDRPSG